MTTNSTLPSNFILFMTDRSSQYDICSGLVHMAAEQVTDNTTGLSAYRLTQLPPALHQIYTIHHTPGSPVPALNYSARTMRVMTVENHLLYKRFVNLSSIFLATSPTGELVDVYSINTYRPIFKGGPRLKRNVGFTIQPNANANATATPNANVIQHVQPTPPIRSNKRNTSTSLQSTSPFLAKQALELAIMKKEQCPITLDDYTAQNTAVMPCGHLFSTIAIAESFKTCPNQCPVCRTPGLAAYV